jgi:hypothetical protein
MHENRETSETPAAQPGRRSAGEGLSHKARAYVYEESHNGIVPMNHSNKDGKLSAESGEGRPLIKENARQPNTYPTQSGKGVSQGLADVRKAARGNLSRFNPFSTLRPSYSTTRSRTEIMGIRGPRSKTLGRRT